MSNKQTSVSLLLAATLSLALVSMFGSTASAQGRSQSGSAAIMYECPMHPDVTSKRPGRCSKCGMTLKGTKRNRVPAATPGVSPVPERAVENVSAKLNIPDAAVLDQNGRRINFYSDL